jgi:O-acetyl-ADP-ribose deacetylase (regulator of RNase III)
MFIFTLGILSGKIRAENYLDSFGGFMKTLISMVALTSFVSLSAAAELFRAKDYFIFHASSGSTVLSTAGTHWTESDQERNLAPRGSALYTVSGILIEDGIRGIIHAASGSMSYDDDEAKPTLEGIKLSLINSIRIANEIKASRLAVPLIGGGIFLDRIGVTSEELAYEMIKTAMTQKSKTEIVFVAYSDRDYESMNKGLARANSSRETETSRLMAFVRKVIAFFTRSSATSGSVAGKVSVVQGDITDFNVHQASVIVNAANTELQFGGGLSGIIGKATRNAEAIDQMGSDTIREFYKSQKK